MEQSRTDRRDRTRLPIPIAHREPLRTREPLRIDCAECVMRGTSACDDCVVSFIVEREPGDAIVVDVEEQRALRALGDGGLVPHLRHRARAG